MTKREKFTMSRAVLALAGAAAKDDDARPALSHVFTRGGRAYATDGFKAISYEPVEGPLPDGIAIQEADARAVFRRTTMAAPGVQVEQIDGGGLMLTTDHKPEDTRRAYPANAPLNFPKAEKIMATPDEPPLARVVLSASLLSEMLATIKAASGRGRGAMDGVEISLYGAHQPVRLRAMAADRSRIRGVIMPMVVGANDASHNFTGWED